MSKSKKSAERREPKVKVPRRFPGKSIAGYSFKTIAEREKNPALFVGFSSYEEKVTSQNQTKNERRRQATIERRAQAAGTRPKRQSIPQAAVKKLAARMKREESR